MIMFYVMIHDQILIIDNSQQHLLYINIFLYCFAVNVFGAQQHSIVFRLNVNLRRVPRGSILIEKKKEKKNVRNGKVGFLNI